MLAREHILSNFTLSYRGKTNADTKTLSCLIYNFTKKSKYHRVAGIVYSCHQSNPH